MGVYLLQDEIAKAQNVVVSIKELVEEAEKESANYFTSTLASAAAVGGLIASLAL